MSQPVLELFRHRMQEIRSDLLDHLATGNAKDYTDYKIVATKIGAIESVLNELSDIESRFIDE